MKRNFAEVEDMAERTEGKQMWKRKSYLAEAAARAARWTSDGEVFSGDSEEPRLSNRQPVRLLTEHQQQECD